MTDLSKRKHQVPLEELASIPSKGFFPSQLIIQKHIADRAGEHFDVRLNIDNKAVSFATKTALPDHGKPVLFVRQPDHVPEYMNWEGDIPKGEYGAGKVTKHFSADVIATSAPDKIGFTIHDGPNKGRYTVMKTSGNDWLAVKKNPLDRHWSERPKYREMTEPKWDSSDHVYTEKVDGAHFIAKINPNGISFTSQRKDKNGEVIAREDQVPHLRDLRLPKEYHGMVLRGELWHDKGFNVLSGILNSKPNRAVATQQREGFIRFAPFHIEQGPMVNAPYDEQLNYLKKMSDQLPSFVDTPKMSDKDHKSFYDEIVRKGGEGVVLTNKDTKERLKLKGRNDYDLEVHGFTQGEKKYSGNAIGAIILKDKKGRIVGNVGTGISDEMRRDMHKNPDDYKGKLVKVTSRKPLKGNLREPVFLGMSLDKSTPDEVN